MGLGTEDLGSVYIVPPVGGVEELLLYDLEHHAGHPEGPGGELGTGPEGHWLKISQLELFHPLPIGLWRLYRGQ